MNKIIVLTFFMLISTQLAFASLIAPRFTPRPSTGFASPGSSAPRNVIFSTQMNKVSTSSLNVPASIIETNPSIKDKTFSDSSGIETVARVPPYINLNPLIQALSQKLKLLAEQAESIIPVTFEPNMFRDIQQQLMRLAETARSLINQELNAIDIEYNKKITAKMNELDELIQKNRITLANASAEIENFKKNYLQELENEKNSPKRVILDKVFSNKPIELPHPALITPPAALQQKFETAMQSVALDLQWKDSLPIDAEKNLKAAKEHLNASLKPFLDRIETAKRKILALQQENAATTKSQAEKSVKAKTKAIQTAADAKAIRLKKVAQLTNDVDAANITLQKATHDFKTAQQKVKNLENQLNKLHFADPKRFSLDNELTAAMGKEREAEELITRTQLRLNEAKLLLSTAQEPTEAEFIEAEESIMPSKENELPLEPSESSVDQELRMETFEEKSSEGIRERAMNYNLLGRTLYGKQT